MKIAVLACLSMLIASHDLAGGSVHLNHAAKTEVLVGQPTKIPAMTLIRRMRHSLDGGAYHVTTTLTQRGYGKHGHLQYIDVERAQGGFAISRGMSEYKYTVHIQYSQRGRKDELDMYRFAMTGGQSAYRHGSRPWTCGRFADPTGSGFTPQLGAPGHKVLQAHTLGLETLRGARVWHVRAIVAGAYGSTNMLDDYITQTGYDILQEKLVLMRRGSLGIGSGEVVQDFVVVHGGLQVQLPAACHVK